MSKLRPPSELTDEQLSQEFYNCATTLAAECEGDEEPSAPLLALLLQRMLALFGEVDDRPLAKIAAEATDEDHEVLLAVDATRAPVVGEEVAPP